MIFSKFYLDYIGLEQQTLEREFLHALSNENLEAAEYLLKSKELPKNIDIDNLLYKALTVAIKNNKELTIEYLFINYYENRKKDFLFLSEEYKNNFLNYLILDKEMKPNIQQQKIKKSKKI